MQSYILMKKELSFVQSTKYLQMQSFTEFQTIATREAETDHFLTLTFDSDEWDIVPQNIAETACIMHLAQYLGNDQMITTTEVVRCGLQKGIIGLEQTPIFKQGLVQQHDNIGKKLQVRFLIVVPGKVFGFQSQHEVVGYPASFVTSLFNARVTTLAEVPGFQLHVDRLEPLHLDTLQDVERFSWIKELKASIEFTKDALNGILVMSRPYIRTSKVQWRDTNQDAQQQLGNSAGSCNDEVGSRAPSTSQREELLIRAEGLDCTQEPASGVKTHEEVGSEETDARSKPLSRARICLEDSLSELKILVGHIQAASYVLNDLHLFTSSKMPLGRKMYPSPATSRWPSTGKERSWPRTNWQHCYLYDSSDQDLMIWPEPPLSSKIGHHDMLYNTSNHVKEMHVTSNIGKQKETHISPYLQTLNQDQPATSLGELVQVQANKNSFYNSPENVPLDAQDYDDEYMYVPEPDTNQIVTVRNGAKKQMHSSNAPGDINELPCTERDVQLANPSYFETHKDDEATGSQQVSTTTDLMQNQVTSQKSTMMIKPNLFRQASARASRAVAFMAHPDIMNASDDTTLSQMQPQPQAAVIMKCASDDTVSRQSSSTVKRYVASEPRASQTEFPLVVYQPSSGQDLLEQLQDNPILNTRQSQSSARKSSPRALGYAQSRQSRLQSANLPELTADRSEKDSAIEKNAPALFNRQDFDGVVLAQNDNEYKGMLNVVGDRSSQVSQSGDNLIFESHDQMETRKSMPNFTSSVGTSQQRGGRRQTYQATNQDTATFQPETRKSFAIWQNEDSSFQQDATFQSEIRKRFANRESQKVIPVPESKRSTALNRQSQDATFQLESTRKSVVSNRRNQGVISHPEARKSMALNKQNQDVMSQPGVRTNFANRQSSMQQPSAVSDFGTAAQPASRPSNINVQPNPYTGELRKSIYQGGSNLQIESSIQEEDTNQLSGEMYDLHQEGDPSDMTSSGSSSSQSSTGPSALHESATSELVSRHSRIDMTNLQNMTDQDEAPASVVQLDNRKSRVSSISNGRAAEQAAASNQQHITPLAARPSASESSRQAMRPSPTRGKSHSSINFDDKFRAGDDGR